MTDVVVIMRDVDRFIDMFHIYAYINLDLLVFCANFWMFPKWLRTLKKKNRKTYGIDFYEMN